MLVFGEFSLDPKNKLLRKGDKRVPLRGKPLDVLVYLAQNPQQLITIDEFAGKVWGQKQLSSGTLRGCITAIRKALEDDAQKSDFIEAVRREGYRFIGAVPRTLEAGSFQSTASAPDDRKPIQEKARAESVPDISQFVGRQKELSHFDQLLNDLDKSRSRQQVLSVYGFGGIGKTTLLKIFRARAIERGFDVKPRRIRDQIVTESTEEWIEHILEIGKNIRDEREKWRNFLDVIGQREIIFIDTEKTVNMKEFENTMVAIASVLKQEGRNCLLVTATRKEPHYKLPSRELPGLSENDIKELSKIPGWPSDISEYAGKLRRQTNGNPFLIESICLNEELWQQFKDGKLNIGSAKDPSVPLLKEMWDSLSEGAQQALAIVSALAVNAQRFKLNWDRAVSARLVGSAWEDAFLELNGKCFVKETDEQYQMHELVSNFVFRRLKNKAEIMKRAEDYYSSVNQPKIAAEFQFEAEKWT